MMYLYEGHVQLLVKWNRDSSQGKVSKIAEIHAETVVWNVVGFYYDIGYHYIFCPL